MARETKQPEWLYCVLTDGVNQPRQRDRRPEELDEVVAQLHNLGGLGPPQTGGNGRLAGAGDRDKVVEGAGGQGGGASDIPQRPLIMEDDDDDEGLAPAPDGTLLASTPARPL